MQEATEGPGRIFRHRWWSCTWPNGFGSEARAQWIALAVATVAVLVFYAPVLAGMAIEWTTIPSLSHGFAVPLISAYLIWRQRALIVAEPLGSSSPGLGLFGAALGILVAGSVGGEAFISRVSIPFALLGITLFLVGPRVTRHMWMAIAYLVFMVPLPYLMLKAVTDQSRLFEAGMTAGALRGLGLPIVQQGVMLHLPRLTLEVTDDCSSVRTVAALLALGAAYALIGSRPTWIRVVLTLSAAPLGLVANILRLILTGLSAYHFGPAALRSTFHQFSGTTVFLAAVLLLVGLDLFLIRVARSVRA